MQLSYFRNFADVTDFRKICTEHAEFQTDDYDQRPEHQREDSQNIGLAYGNTVFAVKTLPNGVYRAGGDIAENHAQGGQ